MTLSIRARLTLWYSSVVVVTLLTGAVVGSVAYTRVSLARLDDDMVRTMATLEGVMRTEFGEGLSLDAAAEEASIEVVVPDRTLVLTRSDGDALRVWGGHVEPSMLTGAVAGPPLETIATPLGEYRVLRKQVAHDGHQYRAAVIAPLAAMRAEHRAMVTAMVWGGALALIAAAIGGWWVARQTLHPLTLMADEAGRITERDTSLRLRTPVMDDELGRLGRAFNGLLDRLASALEQQRQFMADASHELRTPVSVVRTATEVTLAKDERRPEEYREALVIIGEQATRLSRLVDALFLLARAEARGVPLRRDCVNLDDIMEETARAMRWLATARQVAVTTDGDQEVAVTGDDALLRRMIGNLFDNAIRHADVGGRVNATIHRQSDVALVRITNDGPGIPEQDHARVFERFVRAPDSVGAGLGLPIAQWIAEAHGGTLRIEESRPSHTTFVVSLPTEPVINGSSST